MWQLFPFARELPHKQDKYHCLAELLISSILEDYYKASVKEQGFFCPRTPGSSVFNEPCLGQN